MPTHINGLEAIAGDCRLLISWTDIRVWKQDIIKDVASADDRVFFVYRQAIYTTCRRGRSLPTSTGHAFCAKSNLNPPTTVQSSLSLRQRVAMLSDCPGTNSYHPRGEFTAKASSAARHPPNCSVRPAVARTLSAFRRLIV